MKTSPINYLATVVIGGVLWAVFGIFLAETFTEGPSLAIQSPEELADFLRTIFGIAAVFGIGLACYWYFYGTQPATATRLKEAKSKYTQFFLLLFTISIILTAILWYLNREEGIESKWFAIYFFVNLALTALLYWFVTFLFSPRAVENLPYGK
ncbi:hypothetical protein [Rufibacter roseolus]|uniref:hypothetical protein n=1 Tax=Rufibacter roseolus TaxID=2817375 RepID=UPI001B31730E|nr:hypothetical protein [Rufibacter roseolus]